MIDVSVIVVNWNTCQLLSECLASIYANPDGYQLETVVVDNHSTDDSLEMLRQQFPQARVIANSENTGFARANNQGVRAAAGRYVLLLNSDAQMTPGALKALVSLAEGRPRVGMVGARLLNPDGTFQASYTPFPTLWQEFMMLTGLGRLLVCPNYPSRGPEVEAGPHQVGYVEGACMLSPAQVYLEAGGLDESYFMYSEDVDLCYAMKLRGYEIWYQPAARIIHVGGASSKERKPQREADLYSSRVRFFRKYYGNRRAEILKDLMIILTAFKGGYHGVLRWISHGRFGRPVVPLRDLISTLKEA